MKISRTSRKENNLGASEQGNVLLEFSLVAPLLILFIVAIVDLGNALLHYEALTQIAREVARQASWTPLLETGSIITGTNNVGVWGCTYTPPAGTAGACDGGTKYGKLITDSSALFTRWEAREGLRFIPNSRRIRVDYPITGDANSLRVTVSSTYDAFFDFGTFIDFLQDRPMTIRTVMPKL